MDLMDLIFFLLKLLWTTHMYSIDSALKVYRPSLLHSIPTDATVNRFFMDLQIKLNIVRLVLSTQFCYQLKLIQRMY